MELSITLRRTRQACYRTTDGRHTSDLNPKELSLYAAARCAAYTLDDLLRREHTVPTAVEIAVMGTLSSGEAAGVYTAFKMAYHIECRTLDEQAAVSRAVRLTDERYSGVVHMLRMIAPLESTVAIETTGEVEA